jgi:LuxR family transcriptional regulator, maltose regulon positive regulatory protein
MTHANLPETKLAPPAPPNDLVVRPRLHAALCAATARPLTLVSASPGAGKTVTVASWVSAGAAPGPVAWASLDPGDADRHRFWRLVGAALDLGVAVPRRGDLSATLDALCHGLSAREQPVVLVLDDFHEVDGCEVVADVDRLLAQAPPALRLVLLTRHDPPLRLSRLRLTDGLSEIRQSHLSFTEHEAAQLLKGAGATLDAHEISMLCRRTEGWAAALRLAALSLRDHPEPEAHVAALAASDQTAADYLLEELLDRQPAELRAFLLRTSMVDALTGDLADALTEGCDGAARLADLVRRNAMVTPLGGPGGWFAYHPLMRELLRAEFSAHRREERQTLHRRAASWLAAHGREREALRHARAADDPDLVARIVRDRWTELVVEGELGTVCQLVDRVAPARLAVDPELALAGVTGHLATGRLGRAEELLGLADAALPTHPGPRLAGLHAAARLYDRRLRGAEVVTELQTLRDLTRAPQDDPEIQALMLVVLGVSELWTASHDEAIEALEKAVAAAVAVRRRFLQTIAGGHLALALALDGRMRQAAEEAEKVIALAACAGDDCGPACAPAHLAVAAARREWLDGAGAERALDLAEAALRDSPERGLHLALALERSRVLLDAGQPSAAATAMRVGRFRLGGHPVPSALRAALRAHDARVLLASGEGEGARAAVEPHDAPELAVVRARILLLARDPEAARECLLDSSLIGAPATVRVEAETLRAVVRDALLDHDAAAAAIERALDAAERHDLRRCLLGAGPRLLPVLHRHARGITSHGSLTAELVGVLEGRAARGAPPQLVADMLTERELAILRYLPTIMSNREIARQVYVSVNTVKTHLKQIYRKLGVASRRDAIARARELHLLGPSTRLSDAA